MLVQYLLGKWVKVFCRPTTKQMLTTAKKTETFELVCDGHVLSPSQPSCDRTNAAQLSFKRKERTTLLFAMHAKRAFHDDDDDDRPMIRTNIWNGWSSSSSP
mmetsp:Transcript_47468/g.115736  ORF Transcript_47468/g.115736 Transcript_47468/m.115736 type:complete len:102 (-) Transcript_47468:37-342(-)